MGTYSDESPDASIPEKIANSMRKIVGLSKDPTKKEPSNPEDAGHTPQESADAQSSSNTGAGGQSTDSWNKY